MNQLKYLDNVKFLQKCIIVNEEGKILALRRSVNDPRRPGCWDFPGGNYEKGEEVNSSLIREIMEESSLSAKGLRPVYLASGMGNFGSDLTVFAVAQVCTDWDGEVKLSDEHVEFRWVTPDEFMELPTGDDGGFLKDSLRAYLKEL